MNCSPIQSFAHEPGALRERIDVAPPHIRAFRRSVFSLFSGITKKSQKNGKTLDKKMQVMVQIQYQIVWGVLNRQM
jgi:hypothetical protein